MTEREQRRRRKKSRSEGMLQVKSSQGREEKPQMTGYRPLEGERDTAREALRLENSYGNIAIGGRSRRPEIVVSEKRRHDSPMITARERELKASRERDRPWGRGKTAFNAGGQSEGAFAFRFDAGDSRVQVMESLKRYLAGHEQRTLAEMLPFIRTEQDDRQLRLLEQERRRLREKGGRPAARRAERSLEQERRRQEEGRQQEVRFIKSLDKALREVKRQPLKEIGGGMAALAHRTARVLTPDETDPSPFEADGAPTGEEPADSAPPQGRKNK